MRTVTVKLPDEVFQKVSRSAAQRRVSKSEIIREALSAPETTAESLYSRIEDLVFDDTALPRDLSSNPRHLKGYGRSRSRR
jgi:Arc/MetJ-type ribon-helix-helix transcriptional regulator